MYDIDTLYDNVMNFIYGRGLKQSQVCRACNISNMTMSRWKRKQYYPSLETIIKLANYLDATIDELFGIEMVEVSTLEEREAFRKFQLLAKDNKEVVMMLINSFYKLEGIDDEQVKTLQKMDEVSKTKKADFMKQQDKDADTEMDLSQDKSMELELEVQKPIKKSNKKTAPKKSAKSK